MFVVVSSCNFVLLSLIFNTAQAFFTAPAPVHGLTNYGNDSKRPGSSAESNQVVTIRDILNVDNDDNDETDDEPEVRSAGENTVVVVEFESELPEKNDKDGNNGGKEGASDDSDKQSPLDPWSIVWYIGSFGGLVAFFLIVSCSEWCCRRGARQLNPTYAHRVNATLDQSNATNVTIETPPPPYHLFAPPPYDSVNYGDVVDKTSGEKVDIFVITVPLQSTAHQPAPA